ncbi:MAG: hypothetical protein KY439_00075 [Actinobacteria bacterium]|nr:hypothetical protein [Actinomycetota bacterium]
MHGLGKGIGLISGGLMMILLIKTGLVAFYWVTFIIGLTYLAAAVLSRSRGSLWAPGLMLTVAGGIIALWIDAGRSPADIDFLALTILALGTGAVVAACMNRVGYYISAMSVALTLVAFGAFFLGAHRATSLLPRNVYVFGGMFVAGGLLSVLRARRASSSEPHRDSRI